MKKILLGIIVSCFVFGFAGLASASTFTLNGIDVVACDAAAEKSPVEAEDGILRYGLSPQELSRRIKEVKPDLVGIGCFFSLLASCCLSFTRIDCTSSTRMMIPEKMVTVPSRAGLLKSKPIL